MDSLKKLAAEGNLNLHVHWLKQSQAHNTTPVHVREKVIQFVEIYASIYGLPQPCAPREHPGLPPVYLPASCKKSKIYTACSGALQQLEPPQPVSYRTFMRIWKGFVSLVKVMNPRSDVCATCELLHQDVHRAVNEPQTEQAIEKLRDHMEAANKEREYYEAAIAAAKDDLRRKSGFRKYAPNYGFCSTT